jgi:D-3-phosphoglycerate dehydrogenase
MFDEKSFKKMKNESYLINTARGKIVDEQALLASLKSDEIAGYATDVLADEFRFDDTGLVKHPLVDYAKEHNNVIIVPHIGGMTTESRERTDVFIIDKLKKELTS